MMYLAKVIFGTCGSNQLGESLLDAAEWYLATLLHNGQIYGDYLFAPCGGKLVAYAYLARPMAFSKHYHSQSGLSSLHEVTVAFRQPPKWHILQDNVPKRFPSWRRSSSLYLFTHGLDRTSPVCCGDSGSPIPTYLLPISDQTREGLYFWASSYKDHDRVWLGSAALEIPAYKQTADPRSDLSSIGRELCQEIEAATGKRTFYYLHRYWGRNVGEQDRLCPMCGSQWRKPRKASQKQPFYKFPFRCVNCRLVSHCADSYDDERHAIIGEYPRQKSIHGRSPR